MKVLHDLTVKMKTPTWLEGLGEAIKKAVEDGMPKQYGADVIELVVSRGVEDGHINVQL